MHFEGVCSDTFLVSRPQCDIYFTLSSFSDYHFVKTQLSPSILARPSRTLISGNCFIPMMSACLHGVPIQRNMRAYPIFPTFQAVCVLIFP